MRVLQLTKKVPYPYHDGESWAVSAIADGINECGHEVILIALNTDKHYVDDSQLDKFRRTSNYKSIHTLDISTKESNLGAIKNIFSNESYHITRYDKQEVIDKCGELLATLGGFDIVIIESLFVMPYYRVIKKDLPHAKYILRAHNVEHEVWQRISQQVSPLARWYFKTQASRLKQYEKQAITKVDLVAAVSERDRDLLIQLSDKFHVRSVPIGIDTKMDIKSEATTIHPVAARSNVSTLKIGFIGTLDWRPNLMGIRKFIREIWPLLRDHNIELHIAGRGSEKIKSNDTAIINHGAVESSSNFLHGLDISIVPLWSGSGTRVKILEAMSIGVPVISTSLGAEGISYTDGSDIIIADDKETWESKIINLISHRNILSTIADQALVLLKRHHNKKEIAAQLLQSV